MFSLCVWDISPNNVNLLSENINTIKKNTEASLDISKKGSSRTVFHNLFSPAAYHNLSKTHDSTSQNSASQEGGKKLCGHKYVSTYKSLPYKNAGI
jgi:hypothetical protein